MIPRVDYNRKRGHLRSHNGNEVQKTRHRPPHKLFDTQAIRYVCIYVCIYLCGTIGICKGLKAICPVSNYSQGHGGKPHKPVVMTQVTIM